MENRESNEGVQQGEVYDQGVAVLFPDLEQPGIDIAAPSPAAADAPVSTEINLPTIEKPPTYTGAKLVSYVSTGTAAVHSHHVKACGKVRRGQCWDLFLFNLVCTFMMGLWGVILWGPMVLLHYPYWGIIVYFSLPVVVGPIWYIAFTDSWDRFTESEENTLALASIWLVGGIYAIVGGWYFEEYFYYLNGESFHDVDPHTDTPEQYAGAVDLNFVSGTFVDVNDWSSTYYVTCNKNGCTDTYQCLAPIVTESAFSSVDTSDTSDSSAPAPPWGNDQVSTVDYPGNLNFWAYDFECCTSYTLGECKNWDQQDQNGAPVRSFELRAEDEDRFLGLMDMYEDYGATVSDTVLVNWGKDTEVQWRRDLSMTFIVYLPATGLLGLAAGWFVIGLALAVAAAAVGLAVAIVGGLLVVLPYTIIDECSRRSR